MSCASSHTSPLSDRGVCWRPKLRHMLAIDFAQASLAHSAAASILLCPPCKKLSADTSLTSVVTCSGSDVVDISWDTHITVSPLNPCTKRIPCLRKGCHWATSSRMLCLTAPRKCWSRWCSNVDSKANTRAQTTLLLSGYIFPKIRSRTFPKYQSPYSIPSRV